jgi:hypothetical protein
MRLSLLAFLMVSLLGCAPVDDGPYDGEEPLTGDDAKGDGSNGQPLRAGTSYYLVRYHDLQATELLALHVLGDHDDGSTDCAYWKADGAQVNGRCVFTTSGGKTFVYLHDQFGTLWAKLRYRWTDGDLVLTRITPSASPPTRFGQVATIPLAADEPWMVEDGGPGEVNHFRLPWFQDRASWNAELMLQVQSGATACEVGLVGGASYGTCTLTTTWRAGGGRDTRLELGGSASVPTSFPVTRQRLVIRSVKDSNLCFDRETGLCQEIPFTDRFLHGSMRIGASELEIDVPYGDTIIHERITRPRSTCEARTGLARCS